MKKKAPTAVEVNQDINADEDKTWNVYLLQCRDKSIYCGIARDLSRRVREHNNSKKGAKYTRCRRPVKLMWHT